MRDAIQVRGLTKSYGGCRVLKECSLQVGAGEIFALLGVNGAGKTTLLECMEGLRKYDAGSVETKGKAGVQLQSSSLPAHMKPIEAARLFAKWNKTEIDGQLLEALGVREFAKTQYAKLSTGQKRRLHLALALTGNPDILFLDEPTAGLDVEGRAFLHRQIRQLKAQGKTILLASHDMAEVEDLCDRIAILSQGEILFSGTVAELNAKAGKQYVIQIETSQGKQKIEAQHIGDSLLSLLTEYKEKGISVLDIQIHRGTLEQHFLKIAGER